MLFSAKAEYACVAMLELAARYADSRPVRLADVADKHGISDRFLVQILLQLKQAGLVDSTRGAAGGYALARDPTEISLYDILRVVDPPERPTRKKPPPPRKKEAGKPSQKPKAELLFTPFVMGIHRVWEQVADAQKAVLKRTALSDLLDQGEALQYVI